MKSKLMTVLLILLMIASIVDAQHADCSVPREYVEGITGIKIYSPMFGEPDLDIWWYAFIGVRPERPNIHLVTMGLLYEGEETELAEPIRPVWLNGLEDLWDNNLRPEFCALERELLQDFERFDRAGVTGDDWRAEEND